MLKLPTVLLVSVTVILPDTSKVLDGAVVPIPSLLVVPFIVTLPLRVVFPITVSFSVGLAVPMPTLPVGLFYIL